MFQVFDNGLPADCHHHDVDKSWRTSTFQDLANAQAYAMRWLGISVPGTAIPLEVGKEYDYSGYGDILVIKEVHTTDEKSARPAGLLQDRPRT